MVNDTAHLCLALVETVGERLMEMTRYIKTNFSFLPDGDLGVVYNYEFGMLRYLENDKEENITFLKDKAKMFYRWNADSLKYVLEIPKGSKLTEQKVDVMQVFPEGFFEEAFETELDYVEKHGSARQKKALKNRYE